MADFKTDIVAKQDDPSRGNLVEAGLASGKLRKVTATLTLDGTEANTNVIDVCDLPLGVRVCPDLCSVYSTDADADFTLDIGDTDKTADADRYADGLTITAAGSVAFSGGVAAATPYKVEQDCRLTATIVAVPADVTVGETLVFHVYYVAE